MFAPSLNPSPQGGGVLENSYFFQKPVFQSFSKFLEYLIKATASILKSSIDANLCLPPHRGQSDGGGTKSVILNSFQDLSFPQIIPHPLPLSWICSTLTETRQKACSLVVSFRSLSGLTSCRPSANPPPT